MGGGVGVVLRGLAQALEPVEHLLPEVVDLKASHCIAIAAAAAAAATSTTVRAGTPQHPRRGRG